LAKNPIDGFSIRREDIKFLGTDLKRPECVLCERNGTLWLSDERNGVVRILPDGSQELIRQTGATLTGAPGPQCKKSIPNGMAFAANGDLLIANYGTESLEIMRRNGETRVIYDQIDGQKLGELNFVLRDRKHRLWLTLSTMKKDWIEGMYPEVADGYIALIDDKGIRVVAEGFRYTNEVRLDAKEEYLYVAETAGKCISRLKVGEEGSLTGREVFGPSDLGPGGFPDGIAFDAFGNLWGTIVFGEKIFAITPEGNLRIIYDDGNPEKIAEIDRSYRNHTLTEQKMKDCESPFTPWMTSVAFGSPDLRTVYIGTLTGSKIATFRSPVAGHPMIHWGGL
jgi:sugar lactone lactonase YvrE